MKAKQRSPLTVRFPLQSPFNIQRNGTIDTTDEPTGELNCASQARAYLAPGVVTRNHQRREWFQKKLEYTGSAQIQERVEILRQGIDQLR